MCSDIGNSVQQTSDGGYVVAGDATYSGSVWLVKTNADGDAEWTRRYGGRAEERGGSVEQTQDGGYIIVGSTESSGAGSAAVYLIKTDESGDTVWTRTFGGKDFDMGNEVRQTRDGGYIVVGTVPSHGCDGKDVWLIKTDVNGDTVWTRICGLCSREGCSVQQTADGGYVIAGTTCFSVTRLSVTGYLAKTNAKGDSVWTRTYPTSAYMERDLGWKRGKGDLMSVFHSVIQTSEGGYAAVGYAMFFPTRYTREGCPRELWFVKTDAQGDTLWTRSLGRMRDGFGMSLQQTRDGGYVITGSVWSPVSRGKALWLIKTDAEGKVVEERGGSAVARLAALLFRLKTR